MIKKIKMKDEMDKALFSPDEENRIKITIKKCIKCSDISSCSEFIINKFMKPWVVLLETVRPEVSPKIRFNSFEMLVNSS